jgi:hypothetical protein
VNAFEALCRLAASERWCWNISCTTCGHMHFRFALQALSHGLHPESDAWRIHRDTRDLGALPPLGGWSQGTQENLARIVAAASLAQIAAAAHFPAWLGYLGLGLRYTEDEERRSRIVTNAWIPQLLEMLPPSASECAMLRSIVADRSLVLTWRDLGGIERGLSR